MWLFVFLVSFVSVSLAFPAQAEKIQIQADVTGSPWVQLEPTGWVLEIDSIGRKEQIVLISSPYALYFTAYTPCFSSEYTEVYSWSYGQRYAKGVSCGGKKVRRPTTYWQGWIHPLPPELRGHTIFSVPAPAESSVQKK